MDCRKKPLKELTPCLRLGLYYFILLPFFCILTDNVPVFADGLKMEVVSPLKRIFRSTALVEQKSPMIELWAAGNEYESAQVALQSEAIALINKVESSSLHAVSGHVIPANLFKARFPAYVFVRNHTGKTPLSELEGTVPGEFPDPLEEKTTLKFQGTSSIFGTWYIPPNTPSGDYRGELSIYTGIDTGIVVHIPVIIHVWNFTLPSKPSLLMTNWIYLSQIEAQYKIKRGSNEFWKVVEEIALDMKRHRQSVAFTPLCLITSYKHSDGRYTFDFANYDRWINIFKRYGFQIFEGSHLFHGGNSYNILQANGEQIEFGETQLATSEGTAYLSSLLKSLYQKNLKLGIQSVYLQHIADEASLEKSSLYRNVAILVRDAMPNVSNIDATELSASERVGMMDIPVTLIGKPLAVSSLNITSKSQISTDTLITKHVNEPASEIDAKSVMWWYTALNIRGMLPNRFIDYPLIKMRMISWISWRYGVSGYLHYGYNWWYSGSTKTPWQDVEQGGTYPPGDGFIVYPPKTAFNHAPISTLRWEAFREGAEDYEYMRLLESLIHYVPMTVTDVQDAGCDSQRKEAMAVLAEIHSAVVSAEVYTRDIQEIEILRIKIGSMIDQLSNYMEIY